MTSNQLVFDLSKYRIDVFQDRGAFHKNKLAISRTNLDMKSNMVVVDTLDGEKLGREHPFWVVTKDNPGGTIIVKNLAYIRVAGIP
jgi:hypothetical protein